MKDIKTIGIDLAKNIFHLHGIDEHGRVVLKKKLYRKDMLVFFANMPSILIGMEACGGANYWARELKKLGHQVKLMAPQYVKPYVKTNKNDEADAEAICEAVTRPNMRFVGIKSIQDQDMQSLHRIRSRLIKHKTALTNALRGLLLEYGIAIPKGKKSVTKILQILSDNQDKITTSTIEYVEDLIDEYHYLDNHINKLDKKINTYIKQNEVASLLMTIPGVGPITATAMIASIGDVNAFKNARQLGAWLGLVPRQHSTGGKQTLGRISKRGDKYLRSLVVQGGWTLIKSAKREKNKINNLSLWILKHLENTGRQKTAVALGNKLARYIYVILKERRAFVV